jgi:PAS domain S-box-containing protein
MDLIEHMETKPFSAAKPQALDDTSEELEELERYINELSSFLPLPFCIINPSGVILNINQAFCDLTGYNDLEIVGETASRLFQDKKEAEEMEKKILQGGLIKGQGIVLLTKSKKPIDVGVSASLRKDKEGNVIGYFLAFSDISELKKLQKDLEKKVEERTGQLKEKIDEMERFNRLAVGREIKMVEIKQEIENLRNQLGKMKEA